MWESERTTFTTSSGYGIDTWLTAPEVVIESRGRDVFLRFHAGDGDPAHRKMKAAFARAIERYAPGVHVDWLDDQPVAA